MKQPGLVPKQEVDVAQAHDLEAGSPVSQCAVRATKC